MNRAMHRIYAPWVAGLGILAFAVGPVFAQTQSLPVRKAGLWEVTIRGAGDSMMRQQKVQQCTNEEVESIMLLSVVPGLHAAAKASLPFGWPDTGAAGGEISYGRSGQSPPGPPAARCRSCRASAPGYPSAA